MELDGLLAGLVASVLCLFGLAELEYRRRRRDLLEAIRLMERAREAREGGRSAKVQHGAVGGSGVMDPAWSGDTAVELVPSGNPRVAVIRLLRRRSGKVDLASACTEVASRLDAGASVREAWVKVWARQGDGSVDLDSDGLPLYFEHAEEDGPRMVIAATRFSAITGAPLKNVLFGLARSLGEMEEGAAAQRIAFAGPRLSAKILSALPFVGLMGAQLMGASPLDWFLSGPLPALIGVLGLGFAVGGNVLSRRMVARAAAASADALKGPALCGLAASGLKGGAAIPSVLRALGEALEDQEYVRVALELTLGATWAEAWDPVPSGGGLLERALQPGWEDGVSPVRLLHHVAEDARRKSTAAAKEAAERLAVKLAVPLGGMLLPAFVLLGLVPIFFALVGNQLGGALR